MNIDAFVEMNNAHSLIYFNIQFYENGLPRFYWEYRV